MDGASALLDIVRSTYEAFRHRIDEAMILQGHECQACMVLTALELKFVVHHGPFVIHQVAGRSRLLSPAVNVAHRLLKNSVTERTGRRAYLLVTDVAAEQVEWSPSLGTPHEERYADAGLVSGVVIALDRPETEGDARSG